MKYSLFALAILMVSGSGVAQSLPTKKISYSAHAQSVSKLLKALSDESGVRLGAGRETANDILIVSVKDQPLDQVMARIAKADNAEWKAESDGWYLIRSNSLVQSLRGKEQTLVANAIRKEFDKLKARTAPARLTTESATKYAEELDSFFNNTKHTQDQQEREKILNNLLARNPGNYVVAQAAAKLDPSLLARQRGSFRLVFSSKPTPEQLPMPSGVGAMIDDYLSQFKVLVEAFYDRYGGQKPDATYNYNGLASPIYRDSEPGKPLGKILLVVSGDTSSKNLRFNLSISDADGHLIDENMFTLSYSLDQADSSIAERQNEEPIQLEPLSEELAKAAEIASLTLNSTYNYSTTDDTGRYELKLAGNSNLRRTPGISPSLKAALSNPTDRDPLSFALSDAFIQSAATRQDNLVSAVSDSAFELSNSALRAGGIKPSAFLRSPGLAASIELQEADGWLVGSLRMPIQESEERVDRAALAKLVTALDNSRFLGLTDLAAYAVTARNAPIGTSPDAIYLRLFNPALIYGDTNFREWPMLRFYGSLDAGQRQALASGLGFSMLSPAQQATMHELIFAYQDGPRVAKPGQPNEYSEAGVVGERTEVLARGVPSSATISGKATSEMGALASNSVLGGNQLVTATKLASFMIQADNPDLATGLGTPPAFDSFLPYSVSTITFQFKLADGVTMEKSLTDAKAVGDRAVAFTELPTEFKVAVDAKYKMYKDHFFQQGSRVPPR